jgi:hypothetical protein
MLTDKNRLLLSLIRGLGVVAAGALLVAKIPYTRVMEALCAHDIVYGDNYRDVKLKPFQIRLPDAVGEPLRQSPPGATAGDDLFVTGDSYLPENRGHEPFVRQLSQKLGEPAYFASLPPGGPVCLFQKETPGAQARRKRIVVLERAERFLPELARPAACVPIVEPPAGARLLVRKLFNQVFMDSEERLRYLLLNSLLTAPLVETWNTQLYLRLGMLPELTPAVSLDPPYLFSRVEVDPELSTSFYYPHDDALISAIADNLERAAAKLRSDYGAELVFMPVPNKYTLYHRFARPDPYDDFLPRLYKELARRNVRYVDLYSPFMASPESVYLPTDSHWNGRGVSLALDAALPVIRGSR